MWIFFNDSFLSIVANPSDTKTLIVRARVAGDIEAVFPKRKAKATKDRDYGYRAIIPRAEVAEAIAGRVMANSATNFKASVKDDARHTAYSRIWSIMLDWANKVAPGCNFYAASRVDRSARPLFD